MGLDPISNVAQAASQIVQLFKANPTVKLSDQFQLQEDALKGQIQELLGQLDINKAEASHPNWFVAGWRPYVGWICGTGLGIPLFVWMVQCAVMLWHGNYNLPVFDSSQLIMVLGGMLGLGAMRTVEKVQGAQGNH